MPSRAAPLILIILLMITIRDSYAAPPTATIGYGYPNLTNAVGNIQHTMAFLTGSVQFEGYGARDDELIPAGMTSMSYYAYGEGFETQEFCSTGGPDHLCNIAVVPGTRLIDAIAKIPSIYVLPPNYWIYANSLAGVCNGWVLSATRNAAAASYAIGTFTCGVRPENTVCQITPSSLAIVLKLNTGETGRGEVSGTVTCNRTTNVRIRTPVISDSRLSLGTSLGAPVAVLSINNRPASSGADIHVVGSTGFTVTANVESTDTAGEYSGSTALIIEYI